MSLIAADLKGLFLGLMTLGITACAAVPQGAGDIPAAGKHHFSLKGAAETIVQNQFATSEIDLSALHSEGRYTLLDEQWNPGFDVPLHYHKEHAEIFYVISGTVEWTVNGETHLMEHGDLVYIPPNTPHKVKVVGNQPVHTIMVSDPGGHEYVLRRDQEYTAEQKRDPQLSQWLMQAGDFNLVDED